MQFFRISPFVRYARTLALNSKSRYPISIPYDARLFYTKEGSGVIVVEGQPLRMQTGCALIVNAGIKYQIKAPERSVTYLAVNFDFTMGHAEKSLPVVPAAEDSYMPDRQIEYVTFSDAPELDRFLYVAGAEAVAGSAEKIVGEYKRKLTGYELASGSLLSGILVTLIRKSRRSAYEESSAAEQVVKYIQKNFTQPITNEMLAQQFGFHPNYLSSVIKKYVGMPVHRYILHLRLLKGMELLEAGERNISWVAQQCGFCDVYYFSRYFKTVMKMSPREFLRGCEVKTDQQQMRGQ